jgi:hypothetical protein
LAHNQEEKTPSRRPPVHIACPILHKCELCDHPVFATSFDLRLHKSFDHEEGDLAPVLLAFVGQSSATGVDFKHSNFHHQQRSCRTTIIVVNAIEISCRLCTTNVTFTMST